MYPGLRRVLLAVVIFHSGHRAQTLAPRHSYDPVSQCISRLIASWARGKTRRFTADRTLVCGIAIATSDTFSAGFTAMFSDEKHGDGKERRAVCPLPTTSPRCQRPRSFPPSSCEAAVRAAAETRATTSDIDLLVAVT